MCCDCVVSALCMFVGGFAIKLRVCCVCVVCCGCGMYVSCLCSACVACCVRECACACDVWFVLGLCVVCVC